MKAKDMFEKRDYEYHLENNEIKGKVIYYLRAKCIPDKINTEYIQFKKITFSLNGFTIENWLTDAYINKIKDINDIFIDNEELQAINQQMKEIGVEE